MRENQDFKIKKNPPCTLWAVLYESLQLLISINYDVFNVQNMHLGGERIMRAGKFQKLFFKGEKNIST